MSSSRHYDVIWRVTWFCMMCQGQLRSVCEFRQNYTKIHDEVFERAEDKMIQNEKLMIRKINDKNNRKNKRG